MKTDVTGPPAARALIAATFLRVSIVLLFVAIYSFSAKAESPLSTVYAPITTAN